MRPVSTIFISVDNQGNAFTLQSFRYKLEDDKGRQIRENITGLLTTKGETIEYKW